MRKGFRRPCREHELRQAHQIEARTENHSDGIGAVPKRGMTRNGRRRGLGDHGDHGDQGALIEIQSHVQSHVQ